MNQAVSVESSIVVEAVGAGDSPKRRASLGSRRAYSRAIGALFLLGFLFYGVGFGLVTSAVASPHFLATISTRHTTLLLGAFLMLLNSAVDVGKGVLFFPILEKHGRRTALAYLATMIVEVVLLAVGVLSLLMIVPIAELSARGGQASGGFGEALASLAVQSNAMAYQIAEMSLGFGCLFLCSLLFRVRLIPRALAIWGAFGYALLTAGTIAELFGIHIGLACSLPGGLFELGLGFWLIGRGFEPDAYDKVSA